MNIISQAFLFTNKNLTQVCLLASFSILMTIFVVQGNISSNILILGSLATIAFFAGFFNLIKNEINGEKGTLKFMEGVGEYFMPMSGIFFISMFLYLSSLLAVFALLVNRFGTSATEAAMIEFNKVLTASTITTLSETNLQILFAYSFATMLLMSIISFILLYWVPVLYFTGERNIFKSLITSLKFMLRKFGWTLILFIALTILVFALAILSELAKSIIILSVIADLLIYYFMVMFLYIVFLTYKNSLNTTEQSETLKNE